MFDSVVSGPVARWNIMAEGHNNGKQSRNRSRRSQGKNTVLGTHLDDKLLSARPYLLNFYHLSIA